MSESSEALGSVAARWNFSSAQQNPECSELQRWMEAESVKREAWAEYGPDPNYLARYVAEHGLDPAILAYQSDHEEETYWEDYDEEASAYYYTNDYERNNYGYYPDIGDEDRRYDWYFDEDRSWADSNYSTADYCSTTDPYEEMRVQMEAMREELERLVKERSGLDARISELESRMGHYELRLHWKEYRCDRGFWWYDSESHDFFMEADCPVNGWQLYRTYDGRLWYCNENQRAYFWIPDAGHDSAASAGVPSSDESFTTMLPSRA